MNEVYAILTKRRIEMYINSIKIKNYRNYENFYMKFKEGLNVIIGANNAGKTNLLHAINLLKDLNIEIDDFNKNDILKKYMNDYKKEAPTIEVEYEIFHEISEDDENDESIIKLLPFLGLDRINEIRTEQGNKNEYLIVANIKIRYELNKKYLKDYCNLVKDIDNFDDYISCLEWMQKHYEWNVYNGIDDSNIDKKSISEIFKIDFIEAERNTNDVYYETKNEINKYIKEEENMKKVKGLAKTISGEMEETVKEILEKIYKVVNEDEKNEIGLKDGNVSIKQGISYKPDISSGYKIDVEDTNLKYIVPLTHNGVGYNNLINIYMLLKLPELRPGRDFRILCLEEPEAHLHPAMQYKLFKYIKKINDENKLNQQIFVTTHSSNITSVSGIENMYMIDYNRSFDEVVNMSLSNQLKDKNDSQKHIMKFLDVTKSDMLFAKKVIFVEGLAEKLILPKFLEKEGYSYENEHISIIDIGGKHFKYFIDIYKDSNINKKILCITDKDFKVNCKDDLSKISNFVPQHISKLLIKKEKKAIKKKLILRKSLEIKKYRLKTDFKKVYFVRNNIAMVCQNTYGSTFEDELFLANMDNKENAIKLLKIVSSKSLNTFIEENELDFDCWKANVEKIKYTKTKDKIKKLVNKYSSLIENDNEHKKIYEKLFFANLFLSYAENKKGEIALEILLDEELMSNIVIPSYIEEGIKWLVK
jgi:hypothetical protein